MIVGIFLSIVIVIVIISVIVLLDSEPKGYRGLPPLPDHPTLTKLDALIETYLRRDDLDPTSTVDFLLAADALKDPFAHDEYFFSNSGKENLAIIQGNKLVVHYDVLDDLCKDYNSRTIADEQKKRQLPPRDVKGRFTKRYATFYPLDSPYPIRIRQELA